MKKMSSKIKKQPAEKAESNVVLKLKIQDLETEISTLKQRLDSLRKAKNNTITKREREIVEVGGPGLGRPVGIETEKYRALEKKYLESENQRKQAEADATKYKEEVEALMKQKGATDKDKDEWKIICDRLEEKCKRLEEKATNHTECNVKLREKTAQIDDLSTELMKLQEKLEIKAMQEENKSKENFNREGFIEKLSSENALLREKVETLYEELSLKEARWADWEEKFKQKSDEKWNHKYSQWISKTERKIKELQEANALLRGYFEKDKKVTNRDITGFTESDEEGATSSKK